MKKSKKTKKNSVRLHLFTLEMILSNSIVVVTWAGGLLTPYVFSMVERLVAMLYGLD